jgi:protocatechuate 3,4-dioxygenase beta subunit
MKKNRRQFLKNTALAAIGISAAPLLSNADSGKTKLLSASKLQDTCNLLTQDLYGEGPFYTPDAPISSDGIMIPTDEVGTRLRLSGMIKNLDCTQVIPDTVLDLWHADNAGNYDNEGFSLRRKIISNSAGFYNLETILPGKYLTGSTFRPSHIHVKVTTPGFSTFTTQLYFEGDTSIATDQAASVTSGEFDATDRIISLVDNEGVLEGTWDVIVDGNGILDADDLHLTNGMIYNVSPNPFTDKITINYGVFKSSKASVEVYNVQGQLVANIENKQLEANKYTAVWSPQTAMASGLYFCVLKINGLQVHYLKILKK